MIRVLPTTKSMWEPAARYLVSERKEEMKNMTMKTTKRKTLAFSSVFAISVLIVATAVFVQNSSYSTQFTASADLVENTFEAVPTPPSMPLSMFGQKASSFEEAKIQTGLSKASLPTYVPNGLVLESIRTNDVNTYNEITVIYAPPNIETVSESTIEQSIEQGLVITYAQEDTESNFNWNEFVDRQVREAPEVRSSVMIDGHKAMLIQNNPDLLWPYEVRLIVDDQQIHLVSMYSDTAELEKVLSSMLIN